MLCLAYGHLASHLSGNAAASDLESEREAEEEVEDSDEEAPRWEGEYGELFAGGLALSVRECREVSKRAKRFYALPRVTQTLDGCP